MKYVSFVAKEKARNVFLKNSLSRAKRSNIAVSFFKLLFQQTNAYSEISYLRYIALMHIKVVVTRKYLHIELLHLCFNESATYFDRAHRVRRGTPSRWRRDGVP